MNEDKKATTKKESCILSRRVLFSANWLELEEVLWQDRKGEKHTWERLRRVGSQRSVAVVARLKPSGRWILVRQYRPAVEKWVLEFPAGLVDEGEDLVTTALRELKEETGYTGRVIQLWPPMADKPGYSGAELSFVEMEVDETLAENQKPVPELENTEDIETLLWTTEQGLKALQNGVAGIDIIDSKLCTFLLGATWSHKS